MIDDLTKTGRHRKPRLHGELILGDDYCPEIIKIDTDADKAMRFMRRKLGIDLEELK